MAKKAQTKTTKKPATSTHKCVVSGKPIPKERVEALQMLGIPPDRWTVKEHSLETKKQGIYFGEHGTSELQVVKKVNNDSIHSIFSRSRTKDSDDEETEE